MIQYSYYKRDTGKIHSTHQMPDDTGDTLTTERQQEMLLMMFAEKFYDYGVIVSKGDNSVFLPDYIEEKEFDFERIIENETVTEKSTKKFIIESKLAEVNAHQKQRS